MMNIRFLFVACLLTLTAACKKDNPTPDDPFLGKWEIVSATGLFAEDNEGTVYEFNADGSLKITKGFSTTGTYTRSDTEISYVIGGIELKFSYTLAGAGMRWENLSSDQTFEFEKR